MAASTRPSLIPRGTSCSCTIFCRSRARSPTGVGACPHPVAAKRARISSPETPRTPKNNANCAATKAPLWVCRTLLACRRDGVHMAEAISELFHHVRRELRMLLNEKMEPTPIDFRQSAGGLRDCAGRARAVINQCHLADQRALPCRFEHEIAKQD